MAQQTISTTDVKGYLGEIFEKEKIHKVLLVCDGAFDYLRTKEIGRAHV